MLQLSQGRPLIRLLVPLTVGAMAWGLLWLLGAKEFGWLGFVAAGIAWSTIGPSADGPAARTLPSREHRTDGHVLGADWSTAPVVIGAGGMPAGRYLLEPDSSAIRFRVRKLGVIPVTGRLAVSGSLDLSEDATRCRVVAAATAESFRTGNVRRDAHVRGPAFLDAAHHPMLRFESATITPMDGNTWTVLGAMTVRGVTQPASFSVRVTQWSRSQQRIRLLAETTVSRSTFGVTAYRWLAGDEITVRAGAEAIRR